MTLRFEEFNDLPPIFNAKPLSLLRVQLLDEASYSHGDLDFPTPARLERWSELLRARLFSINRHPDGDRAAR